MKEAMTVGKDGEEDTPAKSLPERDNAEEENGEIGP